MPAEFDVGKAKWLIKQMQNVVFELESMFETQKTAVTPTLSVQSNNVAGSFDGKEAVMQLFDEKMRESLGFEEVNGYVHVKPKKFLGSENFAKIARVVKDNGGEYVSAGRDSHFRVYLKELR